MPYWYYEKKALEHTPSIQDGIDSGTECTYRKDGAQLILKICNEMDLGINTAATGVMYFHRFYMMHSFKTFPRYITACCCLFLAGKAEETPKKCKDIIKIAKKLLDNKDFSTFGENPKKEVMVLEKILLQSIKFDLKVQHPYYYLMKYVKYLKAHKKKLAKMVNMAWIFINDSLSTTLPLQWEPEIIAISVIHLAGKLTKLDVSDWHKKKAHQLMWWDGFVEELSKESVEDVCHQILDIYVPWQNQSPQKALPNRRKKTGGNQPKTIKKTQNLVNKKDNVTSKVNVLDGNENIVNVKRSNEIIPKSPAAISLADPRLEFSTACGYHICHECKTKVDPDKAITVSTPNLSQNNIQSPDKPTCSLQRDFTINPPNMNITITIENRNFDVDKDQNHHINQHSGSKEDKVNDPKCEDDCPVLRAREIDSDCNRSSFKWRESRYNRRTFPNCNSNNRYDKQSFRNSRCEPFQDRGFEKVFNDPKKRGFDGSDESSEYQDNGPSRSPHRKKRCGYTISSDYSDSGDQKPKVFESRGFEYKNYSPTYRSRRFGDRFSGLYSNRGYRHRSNGFEHKNRGFFKKFSHRRDFASKNRNFQKNFSSDRTFRDPHSNILSESLGFSDNDTSSNRNESWSSKKNWDRKSNILSESRGFNNNGSSEDRSCMDESWSPMKNQDPKIDSTSNSVCLNDKSTSLKDCSFMNESWSPVENRDPRLLAKNRRSNETMHSQTDNSKSFPTEEEENWD